MLLTKKTKIRSFVKKSESKLRYFGDLRNHLVHGFRLDNRHYIHVSEHAVKQITTIHDELTKPQTLIESVHDTIILAQLGDPLDAVLAMMKEQSLQYLPVYQESVFLGILSFSDILAWLVNEKIVDTHEMTIEDVDIGYATEYVFVDGNTSVYELPDILASQENAEVVLATEVGTEGKKIRALLSVHELIRLGRDT